MSASPPSGPNPWRSWPRPRRPTPRCVAYVAAIEAWPEVAEVSVEPLPGGTTTEVEVRPGQQGQADGEALVHRLRGDRPPFATLVTGDAAELVDHKAAIAERLPLALALVMLGTLVVLFLMTGSIVVAVKAVVMNVLSLGATFGALVWVFQDGHLTGLLGFDSVGALDATIPLVIFIFAFGLSMDYEVFLLSRIREAWIETGDNSLAVRLGLQRSGRIITSAALLIVIVFAGFAMGGLLLVKQLGVGLAVAVIVDATVVRLLLVPATMSLLGRWNWWSPAPLRRLHQRFGLHEPASAAASAASAERRSGGGSPVDDRVEDGVVDGAASRHHTVALEAGLLGHPLRGVVAGRDQQLHLPEPEVLPGPAHQCPQGQGGDAPATGLGGYPVARLGSAGVPVDVLETDRAEQLAGLGGGDGEVGRHVLGSPLVRQLEQPDGVTGGVGAGQRRPPLDLDVLARVVHEGHVGRLPRTKGEPARGDRRVADRPHASIPRAKPRSCASIRAVAPQTVSSSSSKNVIDRSSGGEPHSSSR